MADPVVYRVTDYGGEVSRTVKGGYAVEFYAVIGLSRHEFGRAYTLGLPKVGQLNVLSELSFVGSVQSVTCVLEKNPTSWIAKVVYTQSGIFNFTTTIGSEGASIWEDFKLPVISSRGDQQTRVYFEVLPKTMIKRSGLVINITKRTGEDPAQINRITAINNGRIFLIDNVQYQLMSVQHYTNQNNETRVETRFVTRAALRGFPHGYWAFDSLEIPPLGPNADYAVDVTTGTIVASDPVAVYGEGRLQDLLWLQ